MSQDERMIVVGSSGHARVVIDIAEKAGVARIVGLIDRFRPPGDEVLGYRVLGGEDDIAEIVASHGVVSCFVAIGDNFARSTVTQRIRSDNPGLRFATLIHPQATIARDVVLGEGTVVMAGAIVNTSTRVGRFVILNTRCAIDHDGRVGDFASLAPGATLGGNVRIGHFAAVGIGATVVHGRQIGDHTIIGAGATVMRDIDAYRVAYGLPARVVRERQAGDKYL